MTEFQQKIIHLCIGELESTLGCMSPQDADNKVREVKEVLRFLVDNDEN